MKRFTLALACLLGFTSAVAAQGPSERPQPRVTCERGPFGTKTYGGTAWELYGCSDNRSIAVVTAKSNPGSPFYFMFAEKDGQYELSGEGTGLQLYTRKAYDDLRRLSPQDIQAMVRSTLAGPRAIQ